jgi:tetratricopeptide (TPR) repeat protein
MPDSGQATPAVADASLLRGRYVAFVGKLGGITKQEAHRLVRDQGGTPINTDHAKLDMVVIGADAWPFEAADLLDPTLVEAAAQGELEVLSETQLWERLGLVEPDQNVRQLYTPAMLADLLNVPLAHIRRWHRRGLIQPAKVVHRLPYFDFQEVITARRLAQLLSAGASAKAIESKLDQLARLAPDVQRPLAQLSVIIEGRDVLLRDGEGLIESSGQRRFDFAAAEEVSEENERTPDQQTSLEPQAVILRSADFFKEPQLELVSSEELLLQASQYEDTGDLQAAVDTYRAVLFVDGMAPEVNFRLAELLYRLGDISAARERYYVVLELDEDFVEARANLGCVLAEMGDPNLAIAAFTGTLDRHREYPDVHYHLARTLDEVERHDEANIHWREFLALAPESAWAQEARDRLGLDD